MNYFFVDIFVIHTHSDKQTDKQTNKQTNKQKTKKYEYDFYHSFVFLTFLRGNFGDFEVFWGFGAEVANFRFRWD